MGTPNITTKCPPTQTMPFAPEDFIQLRPYRNGYESRKLGIPDPWCSRFKKSVYPNLDEEISNTRKEEYGHDTKIRAHAKYRMYGKKQSGLSGSISLNATILIQCTESRCKKHLRKTFTSYEPPYLSSFGHPWLVYTKGLSWSASSEIDEVGLFSRSTQISAPFSVWVEDTVKDAVIRGLFFKVQAYPLNSQDIRIARVGGIVIYSGKKYALSTGHTFLASSNSLDSSSKAYKHSSKLQNSSRSVSSEDTDMSSSDTSDSDMSQRLDQQLTNIDFVKWEVVSDALICSFLGNDRIGSSSANRSSATYSNWSLIPLADDPSLGNKMEHIGSAGQTLKVMPEVELTPGKVDLLCGSDMTLHGFLMPGTGFLQTPQGSLSVIEIAMESVMPCRVSGCWVVRDSYVLGHVVACSSDGFECYMLAMERVFEDIEVVTGSAPTLFSSETENSHKLGALFENLSASTSMDQPHQSGLGAAFNGLPDNNDFPTSKHREVEESAEELPSPSRAISESNFRSGFHPEKAAPVTYRAELYQVLQALDGRVSMKLEKSFDHDQPIQTRAPDRILASGYVFQVNSLFATMPLAGAVPVSEQQPGSLVQSGLPAYYDPEDPPEIRAKLSTEIYIRSAILQEALELVVCDAELLRYEAGALVMQEPFCALFFYEAELKSLCEDEASDPKQRSQLSQLLHFSSGFYADELSFEKVRRRLATPICTFRWSWLLFRPGTLVYTWQNGKTIACAVDKCRLIGLDDLGRAAMNARRDLQFQDRLEAIELSMFYMEYDGELVGRRRISITIWPFKGTRTITSLPAYPISYGDESLRQQLIKTGKLYWHLTRPSYLRYNGVTLSKSQRILQGRILVDMETFYSREDLGLLQTPKLHFPRDGSELRPSFVKPRQQDIEDFISVEDVRRYRAAVRSAYKRSKDKQASEETLPDFVDPKNGPSELSANCYMICARQVYGFVLGENVWEALDIDNIEDISFSEDALDNLVVSDRIDKLLRVLCATHRLRETEVDSPKPQQSALDNLISSKMQDSSIFLLHGPPGVGKTMSCECITEMTHRPLLRLTVKDLGLQAARLYDNLYNWMTLARRWEAVLLIDEADIYLSIREKSSPDGNACVAVFLHLMEYHSGILLLTTNRVGVFDRSIFSRIHVTLYYSNFNDESKKRLWDMLLSRIDIFVDSDVRNTSVESLNLNGREMMNVVNKAVSIAKERSKRFGKDYQERVCWEDFQMVIDTKEEMKSYMEEVAGHDEIEMSKLRTERDDTWDLYLLDRPSRGRRGSLLRTTGHIEQSR